MMAAVRKDVAAHSPLDISFGLCSEAGKTAAVKSDVSKNCRVLMATVPMKDGHLLNTKKNSKSDGGLDDSSQKKRNIRYDSADSSDSGVGGESLVWSPCSSLLSYSPPPLLSDLEDDIPTEGIHLPCPPPSPPQSSPSSPTDHASTSPCHVNIMPPNDASGGIRVGRKGPNSDRLIGRCSRVMSVDPLEVSTALLLHDDINTLHKDRPPDPLSSSPRTRRMLNSSSSNRSPKKRGVDGGPDADRRLKACRAYANGGSEAMPLEGGQVTTEPGLLARLSGLSEENEVKVGRCSPRGKGFTRKGFREDKVRSLWRSEDEISKLKEAKQQLLCNLNNNHSSRNNNLSQESERRNLSQFSQASFPTSLTSSTEPSPSLTPPLFSNSSSSSSSSTSGLGSFRNEELSSPNSGTSTPTFSVAPSQQVTKSSPKVRFPAPEKKECGGEKDVCRWHNCGTNLDQSSSLLEHIQAVHVEGQLEAESFRCLWVGCKVFDRASCSVSWLERHVLTHGGQKPFKCIVDGCGLRFRSQTALGRHVNHHFSSPTAAPAPRVQNHTSPTKLIRKNGRKLRYRKRPWSDTQSKTIVPRAFDFFDLSTMEKVRWGLLCASEAQTESSVKVPCDHINFQSEVLCQRTNSNGEREVLVRWSPCDILPNEWVNLKDFVQTRSVAFHKLSYEGQIVASKLLHPSLKPPSATNRRKRGPLRKPSSLFGYAESITRVTDSSAASSEPSRNKTITSIARELFTKNGKLNILVD